MDIDFRVDTNVLNHHKIKKLRHILGAEGVLSLLNLWGHTRRHKWTGELTNMGIDDIEIAADWRGERGQLVHTLVTLSLLDHNGEWHEVHDWAEHNPYAAKTDERRAQASKAAKVKHAKKRGVNLDEEPASADSSQKTCSQHEKSVLGAAKNPAPLPLPVPEPEDISTSSSRACALTKTEAIRLLLTVQTVFLKSWPEITPLLDIHFTESMILNITENVGLDQARASPDFWETLTKRARASPYLRGEVKYKGRLFNGMSLNWITQPDSVAKIDSGLYDDKTPRASPPPVDPDDYDPVSSF